GESVEMNQRGATLVVLAPLGLVAEVTCRAGDGLARALAHVCSPVHHLGGGCEGDPGLLRHVLQGDALSVRPALRHDLTSRRVPEHRHWCAAVNTIFPRAHLDRPARDL